MPIPRLSRLLPALSLLLLLLPAWAQEKAPPDRGYIQGGQYHNVLFGFAYRLPAGWEGSTVGAGRDMDKVAELAAKDEAAAEAMRQGAKANVPLLMVTKPGSKMSISVAALDIYFMPELGSTTQFLDATVDWINAQTAMKTEKIGGGLTEIAGRKVESRWLKSSFGDKYIYQSITVFMDQKYLVQFVGTFETEEELKKNDIAAALTFAPQAAKAAAPAAAPAKPKEPRPQDGEVKNGTYTNPFFGLTVTVPESWEIQEQEAAERLRAAGERQSDPDDKTSPEDREAAMQQVKFMVTVMPKVRGAVLMSFCQDLLLAPDLDSAEQYLKLMAAGMTGGEWVTPPKEVLISGRKFSHGEYTQKVGEATAIHALYVVVEKRFAMVFDVISADPALRKEGQKIVEGVRFAAAPEAAKKP